MNRIAQVLNKLQVANATDTMAKLQPDEASTLLEAYAALMSAAHATLLWHSAAPWSDDKRAEWRALTGSDSATTKQLCDVTREALQLAEPDDRREVTTC